MTPASRPPARQILKLIACLVVISAVGRSFYGLIYATEKPPEIDRYGCISNQVVSGSTIVFIDRTDSYSAAQITVVRTELTGIHDAVEPGDMLTIATIGGDLPAGVSFRACSPADKGDAQPLFKSFQRNQDWLELRRIYEEKFEQPVRKLATELPLDVTTAHSPIIQSIAGVMEQLGPQWSRVHKRKITLITDLMENTEAFSDYRAESNLKSFAAVRTEIPYIRDTPVDLRNVAVTVLYLTGMPNNSGLQGLEHQKFWRDLIAFYGGDLVDWVVVPND